MLPPLDIFRVDAPGQLIWQDSAQTVELAKLRVRILMVSRPADYLIYSQTTGKKIVVSQTDG